MAKKGSKKPVPVWVHAACLGGAYFFAGLLILMAIMGWPVPLPVRVGDEARREPPPEPLPEKFVPRKRIETAQLFSGVTYRSRIETEEGRTATVERGDAESYVVDLAVRVKVPRANATLEELSRLNPALGRLLPGLGEMLPGANVSGFYHALYERKVNDVQSSVDRLEQLLSRHNFFDCETILELRHPRSGRKVLLVQAEMDVVTDGSDADRTTEVDSSSQFYQPFTSYKWKKRTDRVSPFVARRQAKLEELEGERRRAGVSAARKKELEGEIWQLKNEISELKRYSFLLARADPFVVLPGYMLRAKGQPFTPVVGDYCVVVCGETVYPAIFGDVGPSHKIGEASLRLTKQINPRSSALSRPVSDLKVTYVIFPGSGEKTGSAPDYARWRERCAALLEEIGGCGGELFEWEDILRAAPAQRAEAAAKAPAPAAGASPAPGPVQAPGGGGTAGTPGGAL